MSAREHLLLFSVQQHGIDSNELFLEIHGMRGVSDFIWMSVSVGEACLRTFQTLPSNHMSALCIWMRNEIGNCMQRKIIEHDVVECWQVPIPSLNICPIRSNVWEVCAWFSFPSQGHILLQVDCARNVRCSRQAWPLTSKWHARLANRKFFWFTAPSDEHVVSISPPVLFKRQFWSHKCENQWPRCEWLVNVLDEIFDLALSRIFSPNRTCHFSIEGHSSGALP